MHFEQVFFIKDFKLFSVYAIAKKEMSDSEMTGWIEWFDDNERDRHSSLCEVRDDRLRVARWREPAIEIICN
jgi:hypothetical protein